MTSTRWYFQLMAALVLGVGAVDVALFTFGFIPASAFRHWAMALILAACGCVTWEVVRRSLTPAGPRPAAWVAFPAAMLLAVAAIPFLVLSLYPRLEGWFFRANALVDEERGILAIEFPLAMELGGVNLRLGTVPLDPDFFRRHPRAEHWAHEQRLELDAAAILSELKLDRAPANIGLNTIPAAPRFRYTTGDELPEQTIPLKTVRTH